VTGQRTSRLAALLGAAALAACAGPRPAPTTPSRPNVLLVTIDTLRADHLGCYGHAGAATPVEPNEFAEKVDTLSEITLIFTFL